MSRECSVPGCEREHLANGLCRFHYQRKRRAAAAASKVHHPHSNMSAIFGRRDGDTTPSDAAPATPAGLRRGAIRRSIEDMQSELHLRRLLEDGDW